MKRKPIIENQVYAAIIGYCEGREGNPVGNGHHMAQDLCTLVAIGLLSKQQRKVFDALTTQPQKVKDISATCSLSSRVVSSILCLMCKQTLLVHFKKDRRFKLWHK